MKNIMQIMQKAQEAQKAMEKLQESIKNSEFQGKSGGDQVIITLDGDYNIKSINVDDSLVSVEDKEMLFDLIIAAYNNAKTQLRKAVEEKTKEATSDLPIPPGMKIPGLF